MLHLPSKPINWSNSIFLIGTLLVTLTAVPAYIWHAGLDWFQVALFLAFFLATGLSITLGYHRLFAHRSFKAAWPVRLFTLIFGAATFENTVLSWAAEHRKHHKFVDHDEDPYDISKGFFHAHMGWILFRSQPDASLDTVKDLQQDPLARWQHKHYVTIAILASFVLPALLGFLWNGWLGALGAFLIAGVARVVAVHHFTFFINSLCHTIGRQPYSTRCSARDSAIMAFLTFGEGYHNFHHAFQHDYRNGVKAWHFDPTKWSIWLLHKAGLVQQLRTVPDERILLAEIAVQQRQITEQLTAKPSWIAEPILTRIHTAQQRLQLACQEWERQEAEYRRALERKLEISREKLAELGREFREAQEHLRIAMRHWQETHQFALAQFAMVRV